MVGTTLSHYHILRKLGEGGMGEVYLADDTRLKRQVALKVLPEALRNDPEGLRRFRTEAEAAARLNHPNIAQIYSIEEADITDGETRQVASLQFITMEYVDGQPLWAHLPPSGLPLDQFSTWFLPLSDALCHAHEHGVTHRDLKPGNIMIRSDGVPKILDFGLARIKRPEPGEVDHDAPTVSMGALKSLTQRGAVLGTPAYMSPEQARGQEVDHRTDLFSFGIVLYQALTGRCPFDGADYVSILSSILKDEPAPVTGLRPEVPRAVGKVVRRCLQKPVLSRYQTAWDLLHDLHEAQADVEAGTGVVGPGPVVPPGAVAAARSRLSAFLRRWPVVAGVAVLLVAFAALATWFTAQQRLAPPLRKFQLAVDNLGTAAISPDGTMLAYTTGAVGGQRLWIRRLDRVDAQEIPDSDGVSALFWSPQSDFVGYVAATAGKVTLRKVSAQGGPSLMLCTLMGAAGATWRPDGTIVVGQWTSGLFAVSAQGGEPHVILKPDSTSKEFAFVFPHVLSDGQTLVFMVVKADFSTDLVVQAGETRTALVHAPPREFISAPVYAPSGHLLYSRPTLEGATDLWAVPFSLKTLTTTGEPFLVAQHADNPSVGADGTLVYQRLSGTVGRGSAHLVWVDRKGKVLGPIGQPQEDIVEPALSPDGRYVAVTGTEQGNTDIWIHEVARGIKTRLTSDPAGEGEPVWSPDGRQIAFSSTRSGVSDIFIQAAHGTGTAQPVVTSPLEEVAPDWSRDGSYLIYSVPAKTKFELWYVPLTGTRKPVLFSQTPFTKHRAVFSPDGRYVAYMSDESGRYEVYVRPFPRGEGRWQVSVNGGAHPRWRGDELFYVEGDTLMVVKVDTRSGFRTGLPQKLFTGQQVQVGRPLSLGNPPADPLYTVTPDGQRFVVVQRVGAGTTTTITVVQSWAVEFRKKK